MNNQVMTKNNQFEITHGFANGAPFVYKRNVEYAELIKRIQVAANKKEQFSFNINENTKVYANDHSLDSWNSRVGTTFNSVKRLSMFLKNLMMSKSKRYEVLDFPNSKYSSYLIEIDGDILASVEYSPDTNVISFATFLGRRSITPALTNWYMFRHYNVKHTRKGAHHYEQVNLELNELELKKCALPMIPVKEWYCYKEKTTIEKYFVKGQVNPVYLVTTAKRVGVTKLIKVETTIINVDSIIQKNPITDLVLYVLCLDGQNKFVADYKKYQRSLFVKSV